MSTYVSKKGVKQRINSPPPTEIYLKEIGFISQLVMSGIQSIQVCSGLEQNRRHLQRSPCNPDIHNPDRIPHHIWRTLYRSNSVQSQSTGHPIALANIGSSTPIFKCNSQRRITYSEWVIRPHGPFPVNPNSERLF